MKSKIFDSDKDLKAFLQRVSSISGIKKSSIQQVWEYTIYAMFLDILENSEAKFTTLPIPYVGKVLLRDSKTEQDDYDVFLALTDSFKDELNKIKKGNIVDLIKYFQEHFINEICNEIESSAS